MGAVELREAEEAAAKRGSPDSSSSNSNTDSSLVADGVSASTGSGRVTPV